MTISDPRRRQLARTAARAATVLCAVALGITAWGASISGVPNASAAPVAGTAHVVTPPDHPSGGDNALTSGGSATPFSLRLPIGSACTGDSPNAGYRVQSYMVPSAVDPATLTFDTSGPLPKAIGAGFRQPLFDTTGSPYVEAQTAAATPPGGPGPVVNTPVFALGPPEVFVPGNIPAGTYNLGIACTLGTASATQLDRFWNTQLVVTEAPADVPAGVTWTAQVAPVVTTTTTTVPPATTSTSTTTTTTTPVSTTTSSTSSTTSSTTTSSTSSTTTTLPKASTTSTSTTLPTCPSTVLTTTTQPATTTSSSSTSSTSSSTTTSTTSTSTTSTSTTAPTPTSSSTTSTTAPTTTSSTSTTSTTAPTAAASRPGAVPLVAAATCLPAGTSISSTVAAGGQITISSTGWKAGSSVTGVLNSDPVTLGTLTADSTGRISGTLTVPATVPTGEHELVLTGTDPAGVVRTIRAPVTVTAAAVVQGGGSGPGTGGTGGLPVTGSSTVALVLWSSLLLVFGRMAVLLGRPPRVLPPLR